MSNKFLILAFDHPNDAVLSIGHWMVGGLKELGFDAIAFSVPKDINKLYETLRMGGLAGVISLGPLPLGIKIDGDVYIWRRLKCPVWLYMLDAIIYDYMRVPHMKEFVDDCRVDERLCLVSPEEGYIKLLKNNSSKWLPSRSVYVPFGHFANLSSLRNSEQKRICIVATIGNELGLAQGCNSLDDIFEVHADCIKDKLLINYLKEAMTSADVPDMPIKRIIDVLGWSNFDIFKRENLSFVCAIDSYFKRLRRFMVVKSLEGIPIDFYGSGWDKYFSHVELFRFIGNVKHQHIASVISNYKAVINFDPNWEDGVHDRVFTAIAMGVPVITNSNDGLNEISSHDQIYQYEANSPEVFEIAEKLLYEKTCKNAVSLEAITQNSWVNRMVRMLEFSGR